MRRGVTWVLVVMSAIVLGVVTAWLFNPEPFRVAEVSVPALRGMTRDAALAQLTELGLRGREGDELADPLAPRGTVSYQSPPPETVVPAGTLVRLGISTGAPRVEVPDVIGLDVPLAIRVFEAAGLVLEGVDSVRSAEAIGTILRTQPSGRSAARAGAGVKVTVSRGPRPAPTRSQ
jgi:eukaryotic-like serine/threonine-protein kinase